MHVEALRTPNMMASKGVDLGTLRFLREVRRWLEHRVVLLAQCADVAALKGGAERRRRTIVDDDGAIKHEASWLAMRDGRAQRAGADQRLRVGRIFDRVVSHVRKVAHVFGLGNVMPS